MMHTCVILLTEHLLYTSVECRYGGQRQGDQVSLLSGDTQVVVGGIMTTHICVVCATHMCDISWKHRSLEGMPHLQHFWGQSVHWV